MKKASAAPAREWADILCVAGTTIAVMAAGCGKAREAITPDENEFDACGVTVMHVMVSFPSTTNTGTTISP